MSNLENANPKRNAWLRIFLLALFFLLPPLSAWLVYQYHNQFNFSTTQQGELIQPPLTFDTLPDKWSILYLADECTTDGCYANLESMQQIPVVLAKYQQRLQLVLLTPTVLDVELPTNMTQITLSASEWQRLSTLGNTFISDPLGNVILVYPQGVEPKKIYKDLRRLLKASRIG